MKSKITGGATTFVFNAKLLNKYSVNYYRCDETGFIQTEEPYWLDEAYSSAIAALDVGLVMRNLNIAAKVDRVIRKYFNSDKHFLDFAGGYGLFTRLMRDKGFAFYNTDKYCQNLFANFFDLKDFERQNEFELVTAFEVFEHLNDPINEISELFRYSNSILFSTELVPDISKISNTSDWWYFVPEIGQHIAFYTIDSLKYIAQKNNVNFYTDGQSLHLFSPRVFAENPFDIFPKRRDPFLIRKLKKILRSLEGQPQPLPSLLGADSDYIKTKMFNNK